MTSKSQCAIKYVLPLSSSTLSCLDFFRGTHENSCVVLFLRGADEISWKLFFFLLYIYSNSLVVVVQLQVIFVFITLCKIYFRWILSILWRGRTKVKCCFENLDGILRRHFCFENLDGIRRRYLCSNLLWNSSNLF